MNHIVTANYHENQHGGIMICGINFGFSKEDEANELKGILCDNEPSSYFSDIRVNNTEFRNAILKWFSLWNMPLETSPDSVTCFEKSIFQTNWLDTQTRSITSEGKIDVTLLAENAGGFLDTLDTKKPSHIIFLSNSLIEALNDISIRPSVELTLGQWPGKAKIHRTPLTDYTGINFKVRTQEYDGVKILALPHPASRGLQDRYIASFGYLVKEFLA